MKKTIIAVICVLLAFSVIFGGTALFVSVEDNKTSTVVFLSEVTSYAVGDGFDKDAKLLITDKKGKTKLVAVTANMVSEFCTDTTTGYAQAFVTYGGQKIPFKYFVTREARSFADKSRLVYRDLVYGDKTDNIFDVYLPDRLDALSPDAKVMLYVHGGGWMMGDKSESTGTLIPAMTEKGMVVFTMNYGLGLSGKYNAYDMLSDVGAMVAFMSRLLPLMGLTTDTIALSGVSAGAHLSAWYAYGMADVSPLKIGYELDIVGPVYPADKEYKNAFEKVKTTVPQALKLFNNIILNLVNVSGVDLLKDDPAPVWSAIEKLSPVNYVNSGTCPTILAYGGGKGDYGYFTTKENDTLVPVSNYRVLDKILTAYNVPHVGKVFDGMIHMDAPSQEESVEWIITQVVKYNDLYL